MKRFFSLVLALVMVLQLCPLTAMAEIDRSRFRTAESVNDVPTATFATVVFRYEDGHVHRGRQGARGRDPRRGEGFSHRDTAGCSE